MKKTAITSGYREQFGSLLVQQVRDLLMLDEDYWTRHKEANEPINSWMHSPAETVSNTVYLTLWYFCHAMDMSELHLCIYDKAHVAISFWDGLAGNFSTDYINFYACERFPASSKKYYTPHNCEAWLPPDSPYDWEVGGPLTGAEWDAQKDPGGEFLDRPDRERHFGRFLVQRVHDVAVRECDKWLAPDAKGPKADRFRNGADPCFAIYPNVVDMTIYVLLRAIGNGEIGMIWSPDRYADNPVCMDLTYNKDLAGLYLRKWRKEYSKYPWHDDFAEEEAL